MRIHTLKQGSQTSAMFNFLRGLAAIYVVVFHLREQLFKGASNMVHPSVIVKTAYLLTSIGYEFVMAFFVLSGFLISSIVIREMQRGIWSWRKYLFNRITRLWVVLIPALIATSIIDKIIIVASGQTGFFQHSLGFSSFIGNLFFLQGISVPIYGQNGPLWSLSYEFWYYILFPSIMLVFYGKTPVIKVAFGLISILLGVFLGKTIMLYFLVWLLGSLLLIVPRPKIQRRNISNALSIIAGTGTVIVMVLCKYVEMTHSLSSLTETFPFELFVGMSFFLALYFFLHFSNDKSSVGGWARLSTFIASFSYTLYLTHYPIIMLVRNIVGYERFAPTLPYALLGAAITLAILIYAWLLSSVTEARTSWIRMFVSGKLGWVNKRLGQANRVPTVRD